MIQTLISICATPCLVGKCSLSCPFRKRACVQRVSAWCCQAETSHTCRTVRREGEAQPHGATRSFLSQLEFQSAKCSRALHQGKRSCTINMCAVPAGLDTDSLPPAALQPPSGRQKTAALWPGGLASQHHRKAETCERRMHCLCFTFAGGAATEW